MPKRKRPAVPKEHTLVFTSPNSSNVEGGSYDPEDKLAVVAFRDKKKEGAPILYYHYDGVTREDFEALMDAESKGKHIRAVFGRKYKGQLIGSRV